MINIQVQYLRSKNQFTAVINAVNQYILMIFQGFIIIMAALASILLINYIRPALLGHYKPNDSGQNILYDFSEMECMLNQCGILSQYGQIEEFIYTQDRVQFFPSNEYADNPGSPRIFLSFWALVLQGGRILEISVRYLMEV